MSVMNGAVEVLRLLSRRGPELAFADVVESLRLPKSTVSRLLTQMSRLGFLERDVATRRFRVGLLVVEAAQAYRRGNALSEMVNDAAASLTAETGYTGYIATLDGTDTVVLQRFNGTHPLQIVSPPGTRRPAFMTAMGRVLLSRLTAAQLRERYGRNVNARLPGVPAHGPQTVGELVELVRRARRERSAVVTDDGLPGIAAVASTLNDSASGEMLGLCQTFPSKVVSRAEIRRVRELLVARTEALGRRLGDSLWLGERARKQSRR